MSDHTYAVVMTTTDSADEAEALAQALVENRLAACVQLSPVVSHYVWQGGLTRSDEILLLIKTGSAQVEAVRDYLDEHHSFDTPEVIEIPITSGLPRYLNWIDEQVGLKRRPGPRGQPHP